MPRWLTFGGVLRVLAVGFDITVRWTAGLILTGARCFRAVPGELDRSIGPRRDDVGQRRAGT